MALQKKRDPLESDADTEVRQPSLADFAADVERLFGVPLAARGFELHAASPSAWSYRAVASQTPLPYVRVMVSVDPRDRPWQVTVQLGEGSLEWPDVDWNGLPLWVLVKERTGSAPSYRYDRPEDVPGALESAASDLLLHAADFLAGRLEAFRRQRAELNKTREPYMLHRPDGSAPEPLPDVVELKRRYSVE